MYFIAGKTQINADEKAQMITDKKYIDEIKNLPLEELIALADKARKEFIGDNLELCSIVNAKSGQCAEDCKFCAQSAHHNTQSANYSLLKKDEMVEAARRAKEIGAKRFDIVTSGNRLTKKELKIVAEAILEITYEVGIKMCASLGQMTEEEFLLLKRSGLTRYHHNLETSRRYFSKIVSTHTFEDRVSTIRAAKKCGFEVCSGGIIGLGETLEDRIDMAFTLKELGVDSVPLNILVSIKGTQMEEQLPATADEVLRTIAIFRIILKDKIIKVAAGREKVFGENQVSPFLAGANGMLIGGYLTIKGRSVEDDQRLVEDIKKSWCG